MTRSGSVSLNSSKGVEAQRGVECSVVMFVPRAEIAANRKCAKTGEDRVFLDRGMCGWKVILESMLSVDSWC